MARTSDKTESVPSMLLRRFSCTRGASGLNDRFGDWTCESYRYSKKFILNLMTTTKSHFFILAIGYNLVKHTIISICFGESMLFSKMISFADFYTLHLTVLSIFLVYLFFFFSFVSSGFSSSSYLF